MVRLCACSKAAMALIREMFGLSVTLVPQGCMLPYEEDPVSPSCALSRSSDEQSKMIQAMQQPFHRSQVCSRCVRYEAGLRQSGAFE